MPKLSPLQWLLAIAFLAFYGFAVFAVTRDYYIRHPVRPASAHTAPDAGSAPAGHRTAGGVSSLDATDAVPAVITESNPDLLRKRADTLFIARRYQEAIPVYRRILELAPADLETQNDLGLVLFYTGDKAGALGQLRGVTAAGPEFQRGWLTLGFVTLETGDRSEAREALERAQQLGPDNPMGQEAASLLKLMQDK